MENKTNFKQVWQRKYDKLALAKQQQLADQLKQAFRAIQLKKGPVREK